MNLVWANGINHLNLKLTAIIIKTFFKKPFRNIRHSGPTSFDVSSIKPLFSIKQYYPHWLQCPRNNGSKSRSGYTNRASVWEFELRNGHDVIVLRHRTECRKGLHTLTFNFVFSNDYIKIMEDRTKFCQKRFWLR